MCSGLPWSLVLIGYNEWMARSGGGGWMRMDDGWMMDDGWKDGRMEGCMGFRSLRGRGGEGEVREEM